MEIYDDLFKRMVLLDRHRQVLKTKRGFTDETIERFGFKSGGEHNEKIVNELLDDWSKQDLMEAQILDEFTGETGYLVKQDGVAIPFYNHKMEINYWRIHRNGLKGKRPPLYFPPGSSGRKVILTESEFKAAAAVQWGFHAVGLQGISMFYKEEGFDQLREHIEKAKYERVYILWDNEEKCVSRSEKHGKNPHFVEDKTARYDVEYYGYMIGKQLERKGIDCRIARLPDEWRDPWGVDMDEALAQGRTREDIEKVLFQAARPDGYRNRWSKECRKVCDKKIKKFWFKSYVQKEHNRYVRYVKDNKIEITNFILQNVANLQDDTGDVTRKILIIDSEGKEHGPYEAGEIFSGPAQFKNWLSRKGNFYFIGGMGDLDQIFRRLCEFDENKVTHNPAVCGRIETGYLFRNCYIDDETENIFKPKKEDGIIWKGDTGYLAAPFDKDRKHAEIKLNTEYFDYQSAFKRVVKNWNNPSIVFAVGWWIGSIFRDLIIETHGAFPILFIGGSTQGGKTTLCRMLSAFSGTQNLEFNMNSSSEVGIIRSMGYMSNVPVFIDEYRMDRKAQSLNSVFRSAYNNQGSVKGLKDKQNQVSRVPVRSALMMAGEASPSDSGLNNRCIHISLSREMLDGRNYEKICLEQEKYSYAYVDIAKQRKAKGKELMDTIRKCRDGLIENYHVSPRYALDYACCIAPVEIFAPDLVSDVTKFGEMTKQHIQTEQALAEDDQLLTSFLQTVTMLFRENRLAFKDAISTGVVQKGEEKGKSQLLVHVQKAFDSYMKHLKDHGRSNFNEMLSRRNLQSYMNSSGWRKTTRLSEDGKTEHVMAMEIEKIEDREVFDNIQMAGG